MNPCREEVGRLLDGYRPDAIEVAALGRMQALLRLPGDVFSSAHYWPGHFTASAVVATEAMDRVALVDHARLGVWLQPGGHFEPDDPGPVEAARREVAEECGITELTHIGLIDVDVHDIPARGEQPVHAHYDLRFLFVTSDLQLRALDGVVAARWLAVDEPLDRLGSSVRRLLDKVAARRVAD
jgi:8-oxo-dGTP pyrophosphatase MutT (NUDIX family)